MNNFQNSDIDIHGKRLCNVSIWTVLVMKCPHQIVNTVSLRLF
jgi:hypothetical protein